MLDGVISPTESDLELLLSAVTALSAPQQLNLGAISWTAWVDPAPRVPPHFLQELQQLPQLTNLLLGSATTAASLEHLSGLTRLQSLEVVPLARLHGCTESCALGVEALAALTHLRLQGVCQAISTMLPGFSMLTGLQQLHLQSTAGSPPVVLSAADIAGMTGLQQLTLYNALFPAAGAAPGEQLLAVLGQLQHLTELILDRCRGLRGRSPGQCSSLLSPDSQ